MLVVSKFKKYASITICVIGFLFALPSFVQNKVFVKLPHLLQKKVNLGLDLRGGSYLNFAVDIDSIDNEPISVVVDELRKYCIKNNIKYEEIGSRGGVGFIKFDKNCTQSVKRKVSNFIKSYGIDGSQITYVDDHVRFRFRFDRDEMRTKVVKAVNESIEIIRKRIDASGTKEPIIFPQGYNNIIVQLPGVDDPEQIKQIIGRTAMLTFHALDETMQTLYFKPTDKIPDLPEKPDVQYMKGKIVLKNGAHREELIAYYPIKNEIKMTGQSITNATVAMDNNSEYCVAITFNKVTGANTFARLTKQLLHKPLAIVLDDEVLSAPTISNVITGGNATISGKFSLKEATTLVALLRAGSLPAKLRVAEERTIGASLGEDSIAKGKMAVAVAFILVSVFMLLSYGIFGFFSIISLFINILLLFATFVLIGATLTLPGIAGIALTIGMAVDANVLLYERMREEMRRRSTKNKNTYSHDSSITNIDQCIQSRVAVEKGFDGATITVLDSNITTLVGATALYYFGSGSIRGFAVTLMIGTVISLFTTFFVTKTLMASYVRKKQNKLFVI